MISFKDFLKRKEVLNEDLKKDFKKLFADEDNGEKAEAVNNWLKNNKKIDFSLKSTDFKIEVAKKINENLPDDKKINVEDEKEIDDIVKKIKNLHERSKNKKEGNVGKESSEFITTLLDNSAEIRKIEPVDVKNVLNCFNKNNINGDAKIDKKEFIETIKEIKKLKELDINKAAVILWLAYFRQCVIADSNNGTIITGGGALNSNFVKELQKQNTNNSFDDNSIKDLKNIFAEFGKFQMEPSVLINFKSISSAKSFLKKSDEELEKIEGKFTEKTPEEKEAEKQEEAEKTETKKQGTKDISEYEKTEAKVAAMDSRFEASAKEIEQDNINKSDNPIEANIVKKRKWYIFNTMPPKPEEPEGLIDFIENIKKEADEFLNEIGKGLEEYKVNKTSDEDLEISKKEETVGEMIKNCIRKNGMIVEDNDNFAGTFDGIQEKMEEIKTSARNEVNDLLAKLNKKAQTTNKDLENERNFKAAVWLRSEFKQLFIDYGYKIAHVIEKAARKGDELLKKAKKNKKYDETLSYKSADQKGQEQLDIKNISKVLTGVYKNNDPANLARYLLINLLNKLKSSKEVLRQLQKASFDEEMFTNGYIFAGSSGKVYAPPMAKPFSCGELKIFPYPVEQTMSFKNPEALLKNVGINVNSLTVDVLKGVKEIASGDGLKAEAEKYWKAADEIYKTISNLKKSIVTEEYEYIKKDAKEHLEKLGVNTNNAKIKDMEETEESKKMGNWLNGNIQQGIKSKNDKLSNLQSNLQQLLNGICSKLDLNAEYQQDGMGPEDIALRQFLKGYVLIVHGNDRYITSMELYKKYEQVFKQAADESKTDPYYDENAVTPKSGQVEKSVMSASTDKTKNKVEVDGSADEGVPASIVTSANADSTYGDGYGYSKKAKAIKKKLNSTTYTYSPNSKLKIVRRTFD